MAGNAPRIVWALAVAVVAIAAFTVSEGARRSSGWHQFGGNNQDFEAPAGELAASWPESGPAELWSRELGDGYSEVLYDRGTLYTMYRSDGEERVVSLDADSGEVLWQVDYASDPEEGHASNFGDGPRATPLLIGDRLYTIGVSGVMHALKKKDGEVLWKHDLWEEFGGNVLNHGYSSSPIPYKNHVIVLVGGAEQSIIALNRKNGSVAWKRQSFANSYATPRVLEIDGVDTLVAFMADEIVGLDPANGELMWSFAHTNTWKQNVSPPHVTDGNLLFFSSPEAGSKGLRLTRDGDEWTIEEAWSTRKIQFYHVSTVKNGDMVYGSTGMMGPSFMTGINIRTGEIAWRERGIAKANVVMADGKLVILDEDGKLYLSTVSPEGIEVHSETQLFEGVAWTAPTIVGQRMFVRDKTRIVALDLG